MDIAQQIETQIKEHKKAIFIGVVIAIIIALIFIVGLIVVILLLFKRKKNDGK